MFAPYYDLHEVVVPVADERQVAIHAMPMCAKVRETLAVTELVARTKTTKKLTQAKVERPGDEAEAGYDVDERIARRGKRGRPTLGSPPASVESVPLDPERRDELAWRADAEGVSTSDLIRRALRDYLATSA